MDVDSGKKESFGPRLEHGAAELLWDPAGTRVVGIADGADTAHFTWSDPAIGAAHATLAKAFKGRRVDLASRPWL